MRLEQSVPHDTVSKDPNQHGAVYKSRLQTLQKQVCKGSHNQFCPYTATQDDRTHHLHRTVCPPYAVLPHRPRNR